MDHAKIALLEEDTMRKGTANLGMFLRLPVEFAIDSEELKAINPMRISHSVPPATDSIRRMQILGVTDYVVNRNANSRIPLPLPFLTIFHDWRVAHNDSITARYLNDSAFDIHRTITVDRDPQWAPIAASDSSDQVTLTIFSENELRADVQLEHQGVLVVNDLYYEPWRAYVDGKHSPVLRVDGSLRGVALSAGRHQVVFRYESDAFAVGWKISLGTLLLGFLALAAGAKRKTPSKAQGLSTKVR